MRRTGRHLRPSGRAASRARVLGSLTTAVIMSMSGLAVADVAYVPPAVRAHNATGTSSLSLSAPALQADDVLLAQITVSKDLASSTMICPPADWASVTRMNYDSRKVVHEIFSYRATAPVGAASQTWQLRTTNCSGGLVTGKGMTGGLLHYRGVDSIGPFANSSATNSGETATAPAVTTTEPNAMVVRFFSAFKSLSFSDTVPTTLLYTEGSTNNGSERTAAAYQAVKATAGDAGTANAGLSTSAEWIATTVALQGAPVPVCSAASVTTSPTSQSITYGDNASFSVLSGGTPQPTVQWQSKGTGSGDDWTNIPSATNSTLDVTGPDVAQSGTQYRAVLTNTCSGPQTANSSAATLTVAPKSATVTPGNTGKTYGDAEPAASTFSGTLSGFLTADAVTATYSRAAGETVAGSPYSISATLSPSAVLGNYDITYNTGNFTIAQKTASVTPDAASKTYGDPDPTLTGTLAGFIGADGVTATYSRSGDDNVAGTKTVSATLSPSGVLGNYDITYTTAAFTIYPKAASVTPNPASKTQGDADPTPLTTGTLTGFLAADNVTATYGRAPGEDPGPYVISATLSAAEGVLDNYTVTSNTATFTINPPCTQLGTFLAPIKDGARNKVKLGSVVPTKLSLTCGTDAVTGRTLAIRLLAGVLDLEDVDEGSTVLAATVSAADTSGVMRPTDGHYTYNLSTRGLIIRDYTVVIKDITGKSWNTVPVLSSAVITITK